MTRRKGSVSLTLLLFMRSIAVVIAIFMVFYPLVMSRLLPQTEQEAEERQTQLALAIRDQVEASVAATRFAIAGAARIFGISDRASAAELSMRLDAFLDANRGLTAVYVVDSLGALVGVGLPADYRALRADLMGMDLSSHSLWRAAQSVSEASWTDSFMSPTTAGHTVAVAYRIGPHTVIAELALGEIVNWAPGPGGSDSVTMLILDRRGRVQADSSGNAELRYADFSAYDFIRARDQEDIPLVHFKLAGEPMVGSVLRIPTLEWRVLVMRTEAGVYRLVRTESMIMLAALFTALFVGLIGAGLQAMQFGRQLRRLGSFADTIALGDYSLQWSGSRVTEFNQLADAFDQMRTAIRDREIAIAESQTAYREILESTSELVVRLDRKECLDYANPAFCALLGVPLAELTGQRLTPYLRENDTDNNWREQVRKDLGAGARSVSFECFLADLAGQRHRVAWTVHLGEKGEGYAAIGRDVTAQWQADEALRRSEARLRAMLDSDTAVAIQWYDINGRVVYWNPGSERMYGYTVDEAVGALSEDLLFSPQDAEAFRQIMQRLDQEGGSYGPSRNEVRRKDGQIIHILATTFAIPAEGDGRYFVCMDLDITEEVEQENARRQAERMFSVVFQSSPVAIAVWSESGLVNANAAWERLFGISVDESRGATREKLQLWRDDALREDFFLGVHSKGAVDALEAWMQPRTGEARLCQMSGRAVEINGQPYAVAVYEDITAAREAARQLRTLNETLEQRVITRTAELHHANEELSAALDNLRMTQEGLARSEKMAALGSLVAGVAHELSTPLGNSLIAANTVRDNTRGLIKEMKTGLKRSSLESYLTETASGNEIIERNLERASQLVTSFRQVAVDQSSSQRREFDLTEVVDEIAMTLRPSFKRLPYKLETEIATGLRLDSYPGPLGQVLTNLINNAIIHAFSERDHGVVRVTGRADGDDHILLDVADDGLGVSPENMRRIFDPFFTTRLGQGGSGLGLHIVQNLVTDLLGGEISLTSEIGAGTAMHIRVPRIAPKSPPVSAAPV